jgi:hypothetical protein
MRPHRKAQALLVTGRSFAESLHYRLLRRSEGVHGLVRADLGGRAFGDHVLSCAIVSRLSLRHAQRDVYVVLDQDRRDLRIYREHQLGELSALAPDSRGRRLVEHLSFGRATTRAGGGPRPRRAPPGRGCPRRSARQHPRGLDAARQPFHACVRASAAVTSLPEQLGNHAPLALALLPDCFPGRLQRRRERAAGQKLKRAEGVEPSLRAWKALVQPLHHARATSSLGLHRQLRVSAGDPRFARRSASAWGCRPSSGRAARRSCRAP